MLPTRAASTITGKGIDKLGMQRDKKVALTVDARPLLGRGAPGNRSPSSARF